jgi:hypothetical protein
VLLLAVAVAVSEAQIDPNYSETLTVYHVNQKNYRSLSSEISLSISPSLSLARTFYLPLSSLSLSSLSLSLFSKSVEKFLSFK